MSVTIRAEEYTRKAGQVMSAQPFYKSEHEATHFKLSLVVLVVCVAVSCLVYAVYNNALGLFIGIPVLLVAARMGSGVGLAAWLLAIPLQTLPTVLATAGLTIFSGTDVISLGVLLVAVITVGQLYDLKQSADRGQDEHTKSGNMPSGGQPFNQQVLDLIPDLVYIYDLNDSRTIYTNRSIMNILGYSSDEVQAMGSSVFSTLTHPDDLVVLKRSRSQQYEALERGETVDVEYRMISAEGEWRWMQARESVFGWNPNGAPRQIIGVARDATSLLAQQAAANEKSESVLAKERELAQLKNRLMTTISHEFRTPLSVILASGELLERYFDRLKPARRAECLTAIKTQIMHLREMLDEITIIMGEEGHTPLFHPIPADLKAIFQKAVDEIQASVGTAYTLQFTAEGDLNPIMADEDILRPILRHLLNNGIKYSRTGDTVELHLIREGKEVVFSVSDHGIGIPTDEHERIFDTLHRASNVSHIGGLGIGLRIVRDYVSLHGGTIMLDSQEGQGTTFTVRLPAAIA